MRDKIITVNAGSDVYIKTDPVFQYDYGLVMIIEGVTLPEEYEVQFGNTDSAAAKTVKGGAEGVLVPDEYLRSGEDIHAYLFMHTTEDDGYSVYHIHIPVIDRPAIAEEEITPIEHDVIEEALEALADAVEKTEANVANYPYINEEDYWMVYDADQGVFVNTGVKAKGDNTYDLSIGTVTTLPPGAQATASITWEDGDARLNLGLPAGDTSTLVSIHDERRNQKEIVIHDGADHLGVDEIQIAIEPVMAGSGNPSPRNIRRISGVESITLTHIAAGAQTEYATPFNDVVYGGVLNPMTGKMYVDRILITKRCVDMDNGGMKPGWTNAGIRDLVGAGVDEIFTNQFVNVGTSYGVDTTGDNDILYMDYDHYQMTRQDWVNTEITVQICVMLAEPVEYDIQAYIPEVELGDNTYRVDNGKIAYLKYPCDTKTYIDRKIAEVQALVLET